MTNITICIFKETPELLEAIKAQKLKGIEILTNTKGLKESRDFYNECIEKAKGKYIAFVDDTDTFDDAYFKILFLRAEQEKADICRGKVYCYKTCNILEEDVYKYIQPEFGTLYSIKFLRENNLRVAIDNLDFSFFCTRLAKKITISNSTIYTHNSFRDIENKLRFSSKEYSRLLQFFWSIHNYTFVTDADEETYITTLKEALDQFVITPFQKTNIDDDNKYELSQLYILLTRSRVYHNPQIDDLIFELRKKCKLL